MSKLELMEQFMSTFVGNGFHLIIREQGNSFLVHTIAVMQKVDDTCPVKEIPVGDYFLHIIATDQYGKEASMVCNWSQALLQNLLENFKAAKEAGHSHITMLKNLMTNDPNNWMLVWGSREEQPENAQIAYVS